VVDVMRHAKKAIKIPVGYLESRTLADHDQVFTRENE
jgi:hypothetical protein